MTERRLCLLRHAKAGDGSPDITRRLTERGRRDAAALGRWLAGQGLVPDQAIVSPAARAQETWEAVRSELPASAPKGKRDDRIYANSVADLLEVIHGCADTVGTLVLVGHNPSMEELALELADDAHDAAAAALREKFPTCALAVFSLTGEWAGVSPSTVSLSAYTVGRDDG